MTLVITVRFAKGSKHFQEINPKFYLHFLACTKDKNITQQVNPSLDNGIAA
jgi:hypothetical protein